jgi:polyisoprenoid-binding protein YceI
MRFPAAAAALYLIAGASLAHAADTDPAKIQAGTYHVETSHTRVLFSYNHLGFSTYYGEFSGVDGTLVLDPKHPANSKLNVTIPVASVATSNTKLDGELRSDMFLDAAKYPTITYTSTQIVPSKHGTATVTGLLTMHGVTKPVTLNVTLHGAGTNPMDKAYTVGFDATGHLNRSDFGIMKYIGATSDDITLIISAAFERDSKPR